MVKVKGLIAAALAAGICAVGVTSSAAPLPDDIPWITVSSWAYNNVSNFRGADLMPESMDQVTDYTRPVTRLQFAQILNQVLIKSDMISSDYAPKGIFADTDDAASSRLYGYGIVYGSPGGGDDRYFYPDRTLTREEMAAMLYRAASSVYYPKMNALLNKNPDAGGEFYADYNDISEYARTPATALYLAGVLIGSDGKFLPKDELTIEQAVTAAYRLYQRVPYAANGVDGENIMRDGEFTVRAYENGMIETRRGDTLYLKDADGNTLMDFNTDIYSNIYCESVNGTIYAAARSCYDKTDVYNAVTREKLFQIPLPVYDVRGDYIITKSASENGALYGLYGYDGNEVVKPEYSLAELDALKENGFDEAAFKKPAADGWIYYAGSDDNKGIYKADTNGENETRLSSEYAREIQYVNGWIYYFIDQSGEVSNEREGRLNLMRADGTSAQQLTENRSFIIYPDHININLYSQLMMVCGVSGTPEAGADKPYIRDGRLYYIDEGSSEAGDELWRVRTDSGEPVKEHVADLNMSLPENMKGDTVQENDGDLYFLAANGSGGQKLCRCDGENVTAVCDSLNVRTFGFYGDKVVVITTDFEPYLMNADGTGAEKWQALIDAQAAPGGGDDIIDIDDELSDDKYTVFYTYSETVSERGMYAADDGGNKRFISDYVFSNEIIRAGDTIYYAAASPDMTEARRAMWKYDLNSGENRPVKYGVSRIDRVVDGRYLLYSDYNGGKWRYDIKSGDFSEIYPCKGLLDSGETFEITRSDNGELLRVNTDGNIRKIGEIAARYMIFVPDGSTIPASHSRTRHGA